MINYILNKHNSNFFYINKYKKNSFSNYLPSNKINYNKNKSTNNINGNIIKIKSPNESKMKIKFTKKIIKEIYKKKEFSPEETKIRIKKNKTNTNSPNKKLNFNRYPSLKKLSLKNNGNIRLYLNNKKENPMIKKKKINHNISLSNNTNITNNNITTNFTNSINNTVASITNNNSNNKKNNILKNKQRKEIKINIKVLYKDKFYNIEMNQFNNGLWLSKKINEHFKICLKEKEIHILAQELTAQINNIINFVINSKNINDFGAIVDINKIIEENKNKGIEKRYKINLRYNNENYYFFVNNCNEEINDMTNIIINNILKTEKYDSSALRDEIIKKVKISFNKQDNKNHINTDINNIK